MARAASEVQAWAHDGGEVGVLLLHGFTGSPASLRPLAEQLAAAGLSVRLPCLPGHGTRWQDLAATTWQDWDAEAAAAFEELRARTAARVTVGLSFGGALALHLAATRGDDIAGQVLINPWVTYRHPLLAALPALKWVVPSQPGVANDIAKPDQDERAYDRVPLRALASALALHAVVRDELASIRVPTLVLTSRVDHVVAPDSSALVMDRIAARDRRQVWLERSYHVATLDHDAPVVADETLAFVRRLTHQPSA